MLKQLCPAEARTQQNYIRYLDQLKEISQVNRKNLNPAEKTFWHTIIHGDRLKYRFLRQKPIGRCILDFYCSALLLDIEIDGESHESKKGWDAARDEYLAIRGIKTIRYTNDQVLKNTNQILKDLEIKIKEREAELSNVPSLSKRG